MTSFEDPNVLTLGMSRVFLQEEGISPSNTYFYHGELALGGVNEGQGEITPIYLPSPDQRATWVIVGYTRGVQGLPTTDFTARMGRDLRDVWWDLRENRCPVNAQVLFGNCERPDDFNDWTAKLLLNSQVITDITLPAINPLTGEEEEVANFTGSVMMLSLDRILPLTFQEYADTEILAEALAGFYKGDKSCGNCGTPDDGCNALYVLTAANSGSPGLSSQVVYTRNDKSTFVSRDISSLGGNSGSDMVQMGKYLVVVSQNDRSHHYITFTDLHAGNTGNWVKVQTNYSASGEPRKIYRLSSNRAIIVGLGGYIYKLNNPTSSPIVVSDGSITAQNFNDVDGLGNLVVAGGNSNALVISRNKGDSFTLKATRDVDGVLLGGDVEAVGVIDTQQWLIGVDGVLYYTIDGGDSYIPHPNWPSDISVINDITFVNKQVGYIACEASGVGRVYRTDSVGNIWSNAAPDIDGLPTAVRYNFVTPCGNNEVATGGRETVGGDGLLAVAQ